MNDYTKSVLYYILRSIFCSTNVSKFQQTAKPDGKKENPPRNIIEQNVGIAPLFATFEWQKQVPTFDFLGKNI